MKDEINNIKRKYGQRDLRVDEEIVLADWLHEISEKNNHPMGQHLTLHEWKQGIEEAKKESQEEFK